MEEYSGKGMGILFYECGGKRVTELITEKTAKIGIFIGSEGGFEPQEAAFAEERGIALATLGKRILRCETAPVAALAVLMNLTGNI